MSAATASWPERPPSHKPTPPVASAKPVAVTLGHHRFSCFGGGGGLGRGSTAEMGGSTWVGSIAGGGGVGATAGGGGSRSRGNSLRAFSNARRVLGLTASG